MWIIELNPPQLCMEWLTSVFYKFCQVQYLEMSFESYDRRYYKKFVILIRLFCYNCFR